MDQNEVSDEQLILAAKEDIAHFTQLYEKYVTALFRYCYKRTGNNRDLSEDITSETFVKAIEKFDTFQYRSKPFIVWLYSIAHNLIVDYYRSKKERNVSLDAMVIPAADKSEEILDTLTKEEFQRQVNDKLSELPDEVQNLFTLRHTEELSFAQIGQLVGKSEGAVKMSYYRGLDLLKHLIAQDSSRVDVTELPVKR